MPNRVESTHEVSLMVNIISPNTSITTNSTLNTFSTISNNAIIIK